MQRKSFTPKQRQNFLKDAVTGKSIKCSCCKHRNAVHIHHNVPVCEGGTDDPCNLIMLCEKCHVAHHSAAGDFKSWGKQGGQKTAASMKSFRNLPQFRGEEGAKRFEIFISKRFDAALGV